MAGRAQAFSDPTVIQLARDFFVPVAEDSSALERRHDDKGEFFRHIAEQGHYGGRTWPTLTRQGSYAFTADGRFLGSINTRSPHGMVGMLQRALERWHEPDAAATPLFQVQPSGLPFIAQRKIGLLLSSANRRASRRSVCQGTARQRISSGFGRR